MADNNDRKSYSMNVTICLILEGPQAEEARNTLELMIHQYGSLASMTGAYGGVHVTKGERTVTDNEAVEREALRSALGPMGDTPAHRAELEGYVAEIQQMRKEREAQANGATDDVASNTAPTPKGNGSALN